MFDGARDLFRKGKIVFRDGEVFYGSWDPEGIISTGFFICRDSSKIRLKDKNLIREGSADISSKIIYKNKGVIYEGGLIKNNYD